MEESGQRGNEMGRPGKNEWIEKKLVFDGRERSAVAGLWKRPGIEKRNKRKRSVRERNGRDRKE